MLLIAVPVPFCENTVEPQMLFAASTPFREKAPQPDPQVWLGCHIKKYFPIYKNGQSVSGGHFQL